MSLRHFKVDDDLAEGAELRLPAALARRLDVVLRQAAGARVGLFNGRSGLFEAEVLPGGRARVGREVAPFAARPPRELWLGLPKREAFETAVRMAVELGMTRLRPLLTGFVVKKEVNRARTAALITEACEQCERLDVPALEEPVPLAAALAKLSEPLAWCAAREVAGRVPLTPVLGCRAVLVGPEGGFSPAEEELLLAHPLVRPVGLGDLVLRVDSAVACGLARLG
jgi:16S rRNA (uracil1498-N3)-methyltransferase